ncbi:MAG: hypothetical protein KatS3mg057_0370 [Herpetosiphonaceae bacterium]|nr:MAG: hypothetical protein KatS3mg057_0370 [Herpetosiphonaceae bacterium]
MAQRQKVASFLALANLVVGIAGLFSPLVTGNRDRVINIRPGLLFGIFAINWVHALLHLMVGLIGIPARRNAGLGVRYLQLHALLFSFLSAAGWRMVRGPRRIHMMMGMALDTPGNIVHTLWAVLGAWFGFGLRARELAAPALRREREIGS